MARILFADDEADLAEVFAELLRIEGHEVCTASDGLEALRAIDRWHPDLAVLDVDMPKMTGPGVVAELSREGQQHEQIPVVLLSGNADLDLVAESAGVERCITKPVDPRELLQIVKSALARR